MEAYGVPKVAPLVAFAQLCAILATCSLGLPRGLAGQMDDGQAK